MLPEAWRLSPEAHGDEDGAERQQLAQLDPDVERDQVHNEPVC